MADNSSGVIHTPLTIYTSYNNVPQKNLFLMIIVCYLEINFEKIFKRFDITSGISTLNLLPPIKNKKERRSKKMGE